MGPARRRGHDNWHGGWRVVRPVLRCRGCPIQQVQTFLERWFAAAHRRVDGPGQVAQQKALADTTTLTKVLETAPYQAPSMRELVTNALLLTILCVVYHDEHNLPTGRAELFQHCVRVLLDVWRRSKYEHSAAPLAPFKSDAAQGVLARLAWWMHQEVWVSASQFPGVSGRQLRSAAGFCQTPRDADRQQLVAGSRTVVAQKIDSVL